MNILKTFYMSDISKCNGDWCERKSSCHRYTAPSGTYQSYLVIRENISQCPYYWDNKDYPEEIIIEKLKVFLDE